MKYASDKELNVTINLMTDMIIAINSGNGLPTDYEIHYTIPRNSNADFSVTLKFIKHQSIISKRQIHKEYKLLFEGGYYDQLYKLVMQLHDLEKEPDRSELQSLAKQAMSSQYKNCVVEKYTHDMYISLAELVVNQSSLIKDAINNGDEGTVISFMEDAILDLESSENSDDTNLKLEVYTEIVKTALM